MYSKEYQMTQNEMLTAQEVANYLKVPVRTVWRWCRNGTLPAAKFGRYWRIRADKLSSLIEAKEEATSQAGQEGNN